jgi:hypothetical protein
MASKYWLKLFHETIYDPKIMMRSPGARLRWYECLCLAGDIDKDGELPSIEHMLFVFRISEEQLLDELSELARAGMIVQTGDTYVVKNWTKRQGQMPDAERKFRDRTTEQKQEYYGEKVSECRTKGVRNSDADVDIDKDVDVDKEVDADADHGGGLQTLFSQLYPGLKPRNPSDWDAGFRELITNNVTPSVLGRAAAELANKGMKVISPGSLLRPCLMVMQREKKRMPDSSGQFKEYINH